MKLRQEVKKDANMVHLVTNHLDKEHQKENSLESKLNANQQVVFFFTFCKIFTFPRKCITHFHARNEPQNLTPIPRMSRTLWQISDEKCKIFVCQNERRECLNWSKRSEIL